MAFYRLNASFYNYTKLRLLKFEITIYYIIGNSEKMQKLKKIMFMKKKVILGILSTLLFSCEYINELYHDTFKEKQEGSAEEMYEQNFNGKNPLKSGATEEKHESVNILADAEKLKNIQNKLLNIPEFVNKKVRFVGHLYFNKNRIRTEILDPNNPNNVDNYHFEVSDDEWKKGNPVKQRASFDLNKESTLVESVDFSIVAKIYHKLVEKSKDLEGLEEIGTIYFNYISRDFDGEIQTLRADYHYEADINGEITQFEKI